jgi:hypothetical protein
MIPLSTFAASLLALEISFVQMLAANPYCVAFANSIASSSVLKS